MTRHAALRLQRSAGNRALQRLLPAPSLPAPSLPVVQRALGYNIVSASDGASLYGKATDTEARTATLAVGTGCNVEREEVKGGTAWSRVEPLVQGLPEVGYVLSEVLTPQPEPIKDVDTRFARASGQLYNATGEPQAHDARQGAISDCFLIASFAAVAMTPKGRAHIKAAIVQDVGGQEFSVRLYDIADNDVIVPADPIVVDRWFPAHEGRFIYCPADRDTGSAPLWAAVLEKAFAADAEENDEVGYAGLNEMGNAATNLALFTGRTVYTMVAAEEGGVLQPSDQWRDAYFDEEKGDEIAKFAEADLLARIALAKQDGDRALLAESRTPEKPEGSAEESEGSDEVEDTHVYVITGVVGDQIHLWDPSGSTAPALTAAEFKKAFDRIVMVDMNDVPAGQ